MGRFESLASTIAHVARHEDAELRSLGKSIFSIPELAFVYLVAKAIVGKSAETFGTSQLDWKQERRVGQNAASDLVIVPAVGPGLVLEFKIGGSVESWIADLEKLSALDAAHYERGFCALVDAWPDQLENDPRIRAMESVANITVQRIPASFPSFVTVHPKLVNPVHCVVGFWTLVRAQPTVERSGR